MYKIIGGDGREYGPVSSDRVRRWVAEGRADGDTKVQQDGDKEWRALRDTPEFAPQFETVTSPPPLEWAEVEAPPLQELGPSAEGRLDVEVCFEESWRLYQRNFGYLFGTTAVFMLLNGVMFALSQIPFLNALMWVVSLAVSGPLFGGFMRVYVRRVRGEAEDWEDLFSGFREQFVPLMLGYVVVMVVMAVAAMPGLLMIFSAIFMVLKSGFTAGPLLLLALGGLWALGIMIYLTTIWIYAAPLMIDRGLNFWPAMELSRKTVLSQLTPHLFLACGFLALHIGGLLLCFVGSLFTVPLAMGALAIAYEEFFGSKGRAG